MARAYDRELRKRVIGAAAGDGVSARAAAARFGVGIATAIVWVRRFCESGETIVSRQFLRFSYGSISGLLNKVALSMLASLPSMDLEPGLTRFWKSEFL